MSLLARFSYRVGDFSLAVDFSAGESVTALFGRSGSGKSTVLRALTGLLRPHDGLIILGERTLLDTRRGIDVPVRRRRVGIVFQDARLFPHLSVENNLRFAAWMGRRTAPGEAERLVALLGLGPLLRRRPAGLSGGERQRVAIAQALLSDPALLLLDEPLAGLDETRATEIMPYLERLRDDLKLPIIYVSHSVSEVSRLASRVVVLDKGRQVAAGPVSQMFAAPGVVSSRQAGAVLSARVLCHEPSDGLTEVELSGTAQTLTLPTIDAPAGAGVRLRLRAGDIVLALSPPAAITTRNILPGRIVGIATGEGPGALVTVALGGDGQRVVARVTQRALRELGLVEGSDVVAIAKAFAVAPEDVTITTAKDEAAVVPSTLSGSDG